MHGNYIDLDETNSSNDTEDGSDYGIFDDVHDDDSVAEKKVNAEDNRNRTKRKRNIRSSSDSYFDLMRAIKRRRQRQEELERQLDPEQFEDSVDPMSDSCVFMSGISQRPSFERAKKKFREEFHPCCHCTRRPRNEG
mmetsp:Transcript_26131/g.61376  ORF Transcript_26131/g.61376 Transcript_26131/m.61376 type:complete len:137 (+) Transcript_26131:104-514(+)